MPSFNPLCTTCGAINPEPHRSHDKPEYEWEGLPNYARLIEYALRENGFTDRPEIRQTLALAEEVGEFVAATRRYLGMARRTGTKEEMEAELADVVITAFVTAHVLDINLPHRIADKLRIIFTRGWREEKISREAFGGIDPTDYKGTDYYGS